MSSRRQDPLYAQARQLAKDWAELYRQVQHLQRQAEGLNTLLNARIADIQALQEQRQEREMALRTVRRHLEELVVALEGLLARPWPPEALAVREEIQRAVERARQGLTQG
jgi:septal ring factor EnvC (AmiA/AmiB activator)